MRYLKFGILLLIIALVGVVSANTLKVYAIADGGVGREADGTFLSLRNGTGDTLTLPDRASALSIDHQTNTTPGYWAYMYRWGSTYNFSEIGANSTITSATFTGYAKNYSVNYINSGRTTFAMVDFTPSDPMHIGIADYNKTSFTRLSGYYPYSTFDPANATVNMTLNAAGIAYINKSGLSSFRLDTNWTIENMEPTWTNNSETGVGIRDVSFAGGIYKPFFTIEYTPANVTKIGIFRPSSGIWSLDSNGNYIWEVSDKSLSWGLPGDIQVIGDWNGDGKDDIGIFRPSSGIWSLDSNGNYIWEVSDKSLSWGLPGDIPVVADWNGDGKDDIGIFRPGSGIWSLDSNGNLAWEVSDKSLSWGLPNDEPVIGDWNGDNKDDIGIFRPGSGIWSLDSNGNLAWEVSDKSLSWGLPNDEPVIGDWNGDNKDDIGIFRPSSGIWSLDSNGNFVWEVSDKSLSWGLPNDEPVIGDWNGNGTSKIGIFRPSSGIWSLDSNGNFVWEVSDKSLSWGLPNDNPAVGKF